MEGVTLARPPVSRARMRVRSAHVVLLAVIALVSALLATAALLSATALLAPPAAAAESRAEVRLTAAGPVPAEVVLPAGGGVVTFVLDDDVAHVVDTDSAAFEKFELSPLGNRTRAEVAFRESGRVGYNDHRRGTLLSRQRDVAGSVVVQDPPPPQAPPPAEPSGEAPPAPAVPVPPAGPAPPVPAPPAPAPGGAGQTALSALPGLDVGTLVATPHPLAAVLPPAVAPLLPGDMTTAQGARPVRALPGVAAVPGPLPGAPSDRRFGLPVVLAVVAIAGVVSLIVRVLLAEPAARAVAAVRPQAVARPAD